MLFLRELKKSNKSTFLLFFSKGKTMQPNTPMTPAQTVIKPPPFPLVGNGVADDTLALQHALDAALVSGRPLSLPRGVYRITKSLLLTDPFQPIFPFTSNGYRAIYGATITGEGGPNERGIVGASGVAIVLDNPAETAVIRIGEGVLYNTVITGVAFLTKAGIGQTTLDIPFTRWSRFQLKNCVLSGCDYGINLHSVNLNGDGNGEMLLLDNCVLNGNIAAYKNINGMAVCHGLTNCESGCGPGGTIFVMGNGMYGTDFSAEHIMISCDDLGPKPNTLLNLSDVEMVLFGGGRCRVEFIDTIIRYNGGTLASRGIVVVQGVNFASMPGRGPFMDGTGFSSGMGQMKITLRDCSFAGKDMSQGRKGGAEGPVVLRVAYHPEDTSRWYFEGCVFNNFSNIYDLLTCPLVEFGPGNFFCPDPKASWQDQPLTKEMIGKYPSTSPLAA